jgi:hypothetical protein
MTKEEALQAIKLLSAMESWALSQQTQMPDYLHDDLCRSMRVLESIVPLMDAMKGKEKNT